MQKFTRWEQVKPCSLYCRDDRIKEKQKIFKPPRMVERRNMMAIVVNLDTLEKYEFSNFVAAYRKYAELINEGKFNRLKLYKDGELFLEYDSRRYI